MSTQAELHNRIAADIVRSIVTPPIEAGGSYTDVLVLLESVIMGVILTTTKLGGDEILLDTVVEAVKRRLAETRLKNIPPAGRA